MTTTDTPRDQAVAWLVGRLRFEQLLADLHRPAGTEQRTTTLTSAKAA